MHQVFGGVVPGAGEPGPPGGAARGGGAGPGRSGSVVECGGRGRRHRRTGTRRRAAHRRGVREGPRLRRRAARPHRREPPRGAPVRAGRGGSRARAAVRGAARLRRPYDAARRARLGPLPAARRHARRRRRRSVRQGRGHCSSSGIPGGPAIERLAATGRSGSLHVPAAHARRRLRVLVLRTQDRRAARGACRARTWRAIAPISPADFRTRCSTCSSPSWPGRSPRPGTATAVLGGGVACSRALSALAGAAAGGRGARRRREPAAQRRQRGDDRRGPAGGAWRAASAATGSSMRAPTFPFPGSNPPSLVPLPSSS